jgi:hypothetical protein
VSSSAISPGQVDRRASAGSDRERAGISPPTGPALAPPSARSPDPGGAGKGTRMGILVRDSAACHSQLRTSERRPAA